MPHAIRIVPYDSQWPEDYAKEQHRIHKVSGQKLLSLDHIGSTSVPGLGGKPIIDILAGVQSAREAEQCLSPLRRIGYTDVTPEPQEADWHYCLGKTPAYPRPSLRYFHLHLATFRSPHWAKHLRFRDYLRTHPDAVQKYLDLKIRLATQYGSDREGYTNAKSVFIASIERIICGPKTS